MAASIKTLGQLHEALARVMLEMLEPRRRVTEDDVEIVEYPAPAVLTAVATFLKHNNVSAAVEEDSHLSALREKLRARGRVTEGDVKEAVSGFVVNQRLQ